MSALATAGAVGHPLGTVRQARWFLVALHIPSIVLAPINATVGTATSNPHNALVAALTALAIGGLQLRHSFAAARGERPRGWQWTGLALIVLIYVPMVWFTWDWQTLQWFAIASALMLLRDRVAATVVAAIILGNAIVSGAGMVDHPSPATVVWIALYLSTVLAVGGIGLYGAARLVRALDELHATRAELGELAMGRERLRVSRDLHDLLGHSLSAVSLKGDLAIHLLHSDPPTARAEIASLTQVARDALHGVRAVTRDEHVVSLRTETDGAAALLRAAGVDARIALDLDVPCLPRRVEDVLAWAVREGVTNVLRHSDARACSIVAQRQDGTARLEIVNDGVRSPDVEPIAEGSGLAGLAERARMVFGTVSAGRTHDGRFALRVMVPQELA